MKVTNPTKAGVYLPTHVNDDGTLGVHVEPGDTVDATDELGGSLLEQGWKRPAKKAAARKRPAKKAAAKAAAPTTPAPAAKTED